MLNMTSFKNFHGSLKSLAAEKNRETIDITLKDESIIEKVVILTPIREYLDRKIKKKTEELLRLKSENPQSSTDIEEDRTNLVNNLIKKTAEVIIPVDDDKTQHDLEFTDQ